MKKIMIDLNVLMDFLFKRDDHESAAKILDLSILKRIQAYICAHEMTTLSYFLSKKFKNKNKVKSILHELFQFLTIIPVDQTVLIRALESSIDDYEDAVIEVSAIIKGIDFIISRNLDDFKKSRIPAISPAEYLLSEL